MSMIIFFNALKVAVEVLSSISINARSVVNSVILSTEVAYHFTQQLCWKIYSLVHDQAVPWEPQIPIASHQISVKFGDMLRAICVHCLWCMCNLAVLLLSINCFSQSMVRWSTETDASYMQTNEPRLASHFSLEESVGAGNYSFCRELQQGSDFFCFIVTASLYYVLLDVTSFSSWVRSPKFFYSAVCT